MQEKESIMVVRCGLKIPSPGIIVRHHSTSLVMPNSYPRDGIFNPDLSTINDSYSLLPVKEGFKEPRVIILSMDRPIKLFLNWQFKWKHRSMTVFSKVFISISYLI